MLSFVKRTVQLTWGGTAAAPTNPTITNPDVYIGGLHFLYECEHNPANTLNPYKMFLKLIDDAAVETFDHHWSITIQSVHYHTRTFSATTRRPEHFYIFKSGQSAVADEWLILEFDAHAFRKSFHSELEAAKSGNDYRVELTADNGVVWVNRDFLGMDSEYFREQLRLPGNSEKLQLAEVKTEDFLDYVYCVHPPALKLSLERIGRISEQAKRFKNDALISACKLFVESFQPSNSAKRCKILIEANRLGMQEVFAKIVNSSAPADLKELDMAEAARFSPENRQQILELLFSKSPANEVYFVSDFSYFLDVDKARQRGYDCTILIEGHESSPIYVKKAILASNSKYFKTLFFGDFKETNSESVVLKELNFQSFLEYLASVYAPSPSLTVTKAATILRLADRFQNEALFKHCADFLLQHAEFSTKEKLDMLYLADEFNLEKVFEATIDRLSRDDLKDVDFKIVTGFRPATLQLFFDRCLKQLQ